MSFFNELKRRNVIRVAVAYAVIAWLIMQFADVVLNNIEAPHWVFQVIMLLLAIGFPLVLVFAWAFEMTPEGLKKEKDVDRSQSITPQTGQKLNYAIIALLVAALGYFAWDKFVTTPANVMPPAERQAGTEASKQLSPSIAVLPFINMSEDASNEYFSDGLTEELLNVLAKIKELQVAGRTSSFAFKGKDEDLRSIGEKLNVTSILEGSVRKDDKRNRVRITAQLINVENGYHLWSETYNRDLDDIFAIQEEIARKVATALKVTLLGEDEARIAAQPVTDVSAYDLYLRGLQQLNTITYASLKQAVTSFGQAIAQDEDYVPAKLKLAQTWLDMALTGAVTKAEAVEKSRPLLSLVLEAEPDNSDAHVLLARVLDAERNDTVREKELVLALNYNPRNVEGLHIMGRWLYFNGQLQKGLEYYREAERIDPYSVKVLWALISANAYMLQPQAVETYAQRIAEIQPANPNRYWGPGLAYLMTGDLVQSLDYQLKASRVDPNDYELKAGIASTWLSLGDLEQAERWAKQADEIDADQPYPIATRVMQYMYREQYGLASDMASRALARKLDNRMGSNRILRRAYVSNLVRQRDIQQALEYYHEALPGAFATPLVVNPQIPRDANQLLDIALLLHMQDPAAERSTELINAAEQKMQLWDQRFVPWSLALDRAAIAAARGETKTALNALGEAYEKGFRNKWRSTLSTTIAFNGLRDTPEYKRLITRLENDMDRQRTEAYELLGMAK